MFMLFTWDVTNTGNEEPGTGVWELVYSGNPLENSKWRTNKRKRSNRNNGFLLSLTHALLFFAFFFSDLFLVLKSTPLWANDLLSLHAPSNEL